MNIDDYADNGSFARARLSRIEERLLEEESSFDPRLLWVLRKCVEEWGSPIVVDAATWLLDGGYDI